MNDEFRGKKSVEVVGSGKSGVAAARLLRKKESHLYF